MLKKTAMKKYYGIIITTIYTLIFRILVEFGILEMNSWTYMIIIPIIVGYIPFLLDPKTFINSKTKAIFFPVISTILFLFIAFITKLEDLGCFIILLPPYLIISTIISLILRSFLKNEKAEDNINLKRNSLILFVIPIFLGNIEKYVEKKEDNFQVSEKILINSPKQSIWSNLFSVPDLTNYIDNSIYNYLGFPNPIKSEYYTKTNTRLGYFSNGIILNEKIIELSEYEKLSFSINVDKSNLNGSQTFKHILKNKNLVFNSITYQLRSITATQTELTLICNYNIRSNIPIYGEFWSKNIIIDFENKLLKALKTRTEK